MEGRQRTGERELKHCYQCSRLEDELWAMAYEQVWPLVRRELAPGDRAKSDQLAEMDYANRLARRA